MPSSSDICSSQSMMDETPDMQRHNKSTNKNLKQKYEDHTKKRKINSIRRKKLQYANKRVIFQICEHNKKTGLLVMIELPST